jgi:hypothetical protein
LVLPSFLDNHDMNRFLFAAEGDLRRLQVAALVQFLLPGPPVIYYGTEVGLSQNRALGRLEEARLPMPPRERWDHELREFYRALIRLRRGAIPCGALLELRWVNDEWRSAVWRIGAFELLVNCGPERSFPVGGAEIALATGAPATPCLLAGQLTLPAWSAALLRHPGDSVR